MAPPARPRQSRFAPILTDVHFWVPLAVLLGGVLILALVSR